MYCEDGYLQKDLPRPHFWEIYGQGSLYKISKSELFENTETF